MKSFKDFLEEQGRKEFLENRPKTEVEIDAARKRLAATPVLTDDEMRAQNPGATAAYEKDAKERKVRKNISISTPEGEITAGGTSKGGKIPIQTSKGKTIYVTPDEAIARAEAGIKSPIKKKIKSPTPSTSASKPAASAPAPKPATTVNLSLTRPSAPKISTGPTLSVSTPTPTPTPTPKAKQITAKSLGKVVTDVLEKERAAKAAEKAAKSAKVAKALSSASKIASLAGAGIEAKGAYDVAKAKGASAKTALGAGAARGLGALGGAAVGSALGSVLGPVGSVAGGVAGYTAGSQLASKAYDAIRGDITKKLTTKDVLTNIRKTVPQEVRAQVPVGARKVFRDLVTNTGKAYGNWQRSQGSNK